MNILDQIIEKKRSEVVQRKQDRSESALRESIYFKTACRSLVKNLLAENSTGIIAEFKRRSPSKGFINKNADITEVTKGYVANGAAGLSILTDEHFFGGINDDVLKARVNDIPILRKEFIIDPYQVTESKAIGADIILLIAACLTTVEVKELSVYACSLGMEVLLELRSDEELDRICETVQLVGVNNRDLRDFTVDINRSLEMSGLIPGDKVKIAESGISDPANIRLLRDAGYKGFLIGETFMKETDPAKTLNNFVQKAGYDKH